MKHFFLISILSLQIQATDKKAYQYDNNADGKIDSTYFYNQSGFLSFERDRNYDGKIDHKKEYQQKSSLYTELQDTNFDGDFDKEIIAKIQDQKVLVTEYSLTPVKSIIREYQYDLVQTANDDCQYIDRSHVLNEINDFVKKFDGTLKKVNSDLLGLENFLIHNSCKKNFGKKNLSKIISNATRQGLSCLTKLAKQSKNSKKQVELFNLLNRMDSSLKDNSWQVNVLCNDKEYFKKDDSSRSSDAMAAATTQPGTFRGTPHPLITINPSLKTGFFGSTDTEEMTSVFFHEMLHNYGYNHQEGYDIVYGCEVCCFPREFNKNSQKTACNVCKGDYSSKTSEEYMKDIALLGHFSKTNPAKEYFADHYKDLKNNRTMRASFMTAILNMHPEMLTELHKKYPDITDSFDKEVAKEMKSKQYYDNTSELVRSQSKVTAEIIGSIFFERDKTKIKSALKKLKVANLPYIRTRHTSMTNKNHPGGFQLLSDIEVLLKMARRGEKDKELRRLYTSALLKIDHSFTEYSQSKR
ncbi:hypothetical protein [Bacteriovorax sp. DB6_IX]|uniref:hypothetical protein n=1 Tax=Bacteriovorax sp. DB6_IX TaxID=1353530 RepID=UPI0005505017|nr:hypothetical protein [Bacteriovorax sp. DB6_IX]